MQAALTSIQELMKQLDPEEVTQVIEECDEEEREALLQVLYDWRTWARPEQLPPEGDWNIWLVCAGRGAGKTRTGAEWITDGAYRGICRRIALVGRTAPDVRDTMVEGESGLLSVAPPWFTPKYEPSKRRLTWPNGVQATCFSAAEPDLLRGPQHDRAWGDEVAAWERPDAYDQLMFGLRLGENPQAIFTTTPRPTRLIRDLAADPMCVVTTGSSYDNKANLAPVFLKEIVKKYEGTSLGRQELYAEILAEAEGALWQRRWIDEHRRPLPTHDAIRRIVVAIDPAVTINEDSDECGIVVACIAECECKGEPDIHGFIMEDHSGRLSPDAWSAKGVELYHHHKADRLVAESNNGGDLVESTIRTKDKLIAYKKVFASQGKRTRAEPVSSLYEQGRIHHVKVFRDLEDQCCIWSPNTGEKSPDRLDAMVWAIYELMLKGGDQVTAVTSFGPASSSYFRQ